jgi:hypothetical protein
VLACMHALRRSCDSCAFYAVSDNIQKRPFTITESFVPGFSSLVSSFHARYRLRYAVLKTSEGPERAAMWHNSSSGNSGSESGAFVPMWPCYRSNATLPRKWDIGQVIKARISVRHRGWATLTFHVSTTLEDSVRNKL